jgi:hypothetical protein
MTLRRIPAHVAFISIFRLTLHRDCGAAQDSHLRLGIDAPIVGPEALVSRLYTAILGTSSKPLCRSYSRSWNPHRL